MIPTLGEHRSDHPALKQAQTRQANRAKNIPISISTREVSEVFCAMPVPSVVAPSASIWFSACMQVEHEGTPVVHDTRRREQHNAAQQRVHATSPKRKWTYRKDPAPATGAMSSVRCRLRALRHLELPCYRLRRWTRASGGAYTHTHTHTR
jgi:hypothetical protein